MWQSLHDLFFVSYWWALFNLLPVLPLDGGHISEAIVGRYRTRYVSVVTATVVTVYMLGAGNQFWFFPALLAVANAVELYQVNKGTPSIAFLPDAPGTGWDSGSDDATSKPRPPKKRRGRGRLRAVPDPPEVLPLGAARPGERAGPDAQQSEALVWDALRRGDIDAATRALARHPRRDQADPFLVASVDLAAGDVGDGIARFRAAYLAEPNGPASLVPATLIAKAGRATDLAGVLLGDKTPAGAMAAASLQNHLHYAKAFDAAAKVGELVYADGRSSKAQAAFETACSWAQAGDATEGLAWLDRAVADGFTAASLIDGEPDLAPIRALPAFVALRTRLG